MPEEHRWAWSPGISDELTALTAMEFSARQEALCVSAFGSVKLSERQRAAPVIIGEVTGTIPTSGHTRTPSRGYVGADRVRHP